VINLWLFLYRTAQALLPPPLAQHAAEMQEMLRARLLRSSPLKRPFSTGRAIFDVLAVAITHRSEHRRERESSRVPMHIPAELWFAARRLGRRPGFTVSSLVTLGVGMGSTLAMFAVVHGIVLNPLPYPESGRVVQLDHAAPGIGSEGGLKMTQGLYLLYRESSHTLSDLAIYSDADVALTGDRLPRRLTATVTTHELASVLRVRPSLGRFFVEQDDQSGSTPVAVLSHALWSSEFGADPAIVGTSIVLDGVGVQVVGVMPASFGFPSRETDIWLPRRVNPATATFGSFTEDGIARLAPGATAASARDELQGIIPRLVERFPGQASHNVVESARLTPLVEPLKNAVVGNIATTLWVLLGTVGLVLLIAGVNVTNLLMVRVEGRHREMALRTALGAGPGNVTLYGLAEAVWLAGLGGAVGVGLAAVALGLVRRLAPPGLPRLDELGLSPAVWAMAMALSVTAGLILGIIPLVGRSRDDLANALKGTSRATHGRARSRWRNVLIMSQTAVALILIVGAGLMTRSFRHLTRIDTGFDPEGVLTFQISLPGTRYTTRQSAVDLHEALLTRLRSLPGVERVGATSCLPLCGSWAGNPWAREDRPAPEGEIPPIAATRRVSEDYFEAMRIALRRGRMIERQDRQQLTGAAVVNDEAAANLFPGEDPIGKRIYPTTNPDDPPWYEVVGIVEDAPAISLTDHPAPVVYLPMLHRDASGPSPRVLSYSVRTSLQPLSLVQPILAQVRELDPALPLAYVRTMKSIVREASARMAFTMVMLVLAASMALFLGIVGVYSTIAYTVSLRTAEFGIRLAIGARGEDLTRMVLRQGGTTVGAGLVLGLLGALATTRFMRGMVFGVSVRDPVTYAVVTGLLLVVALLALYRPARRAAAVDPMRSLWPE
jgi:putative ABC transport system permease protein